MLRKHCCVKRSKQMHTEVSFFFWLGKETIDSCAVLASLGKTNKINFPSFIRDKTLFWNHIKQRANIVISGAEQSSVTSEAQQGGQG